MIADDLGWNDVGFHGSEIRTPNIDRIAKEGVELDRFYVHPSCSPTRAALMTGKSSISMGVYRPINKHTYQGLPLDEKLLPEYLAELGYERFMVGKWHLGKHAKAQLPNARGFEHFYGSLTGGIGYWDKVHGGGYDWQRNGKTVRDSGYATHLLVDEVRTLISRRDVAKPNFMYVAFQAPHTPNEAPEETIAKYEIADANRRVHAAMVDELDNAVGEILELYTDAGMLKNTIVVFMSDNGGLLRVDKDNPKNQTGLQQAALWIDWLFERPVNFIPGFEFILSWAFDGGSDNSPLQGGKGSSAEGGIRVPAAIWWQGRLENGNHDQFMSVADVLPTLLEAIDAGSDIPLDLNGRSQWRALTGGVSETSVHLVSGLEGEFAVLKWPWKYVSGAEAKLYNVEKDPEESNNLLSLKKQVSLELKQIVDEWEYGPQADFSFTKMLFDPDTFGGEESGLPWAERVTD